MVRGDVPPDEGVGQRRVSAGAKAPATTPLLLIASGLRDAGGRKENSRVVHRPARPEKDVAVAQATDDSDVRFPPSGLDRSIA